MRRANEILLRAILGTSTTVSAGLSQATETTLWGSLE